MRVRFSDVPEADEASDRARRRAKACTCSVVCAAVRDRVWRSLSAYSLKRDVGTGGQYESYERGVQTALCDMWLCDIEARLRPASVYQGASRVLRTPAAMPLKWQRNYRRKR